MSPIRNYPGRTATLGLFAVALLACAPISAHAQLLRPTDGIAQVKLAYEGLGVDTVCARSIPDDFTQIPGYHPQTIFWAAELLGMRDKQRTSPKQPTIEWRNEAAAHLRAHWSPHANQGACGFDLKAAAWYADAGALLGAIDASYLFSQTAHGAWQFLAVAQMSNTNTFAAALQSPTLVGAGISYTSPDVLNPIFGRKSRFDLRTRLTLREDVVRDSTGGIPLDWRARPVGGASTAVVVREIRSGLVYQAQVYPAISGARQFIAQSTSLGVGPFGAHGAFGLLRYMWFRPSEQFERQQLAAHIGISAFD